MFSTVPRERDFATELDKQFYYRMQKQDLKREKGLQYTISVPPLHTMLVFDSRFESGNLRKAAKVNNVEYNLWLENDINTKGHTQWFFFKVVCSSEKPAKIQFNILNLAKPHSLYKTGMKPVVFSLQHFLAKQQRPADFDPCRYKEHWQRGCENIKYQQNEMTRSGFAVPNSQSDKFLQNNNGLGEGALNYYTLSFDYKFEHAHDEVWFANAVPYTYSDLNRFVKAQTHADLRAEVLCLSLAGRPVPLLTITDELASYLSYQEQLALQNSLPSLLKKQFRQKYQQCRKLLKQAQESKGKVQKLLEQAAEEEIHHFFEQN